MQPPPWAFLFPRQTESFIWNHIAYHLNFSYSVHFLPLYFYSNCLTPFFTYTYWFQWHRTLLIFNLPFSSYCFWVFFTGSSSVHLLNTGFLRVLFRVLQDLYSLGPPWKTLHLLQLLPTCWWLLVTSPHFSPQQLVYVSTFYWPPYSTLTWSSPSLNPNSYSSFSDFFHDSNHTEWKHYPPNHLS